LITCTNDCITTVFDAKPFVQASDCVFINHDVLYYQRYD
jgi:uncharacterized pyridoxamine 5'-phosphate oxidase family protein